MQVIWIPIYAILCLRMVKCCDCNLEEIVKDTVMKSSSITMKKRQMHDDEDDSAEMMEDSETTEGITATTDETTKLLVLKSAEATEKYKQEESNECMFCDTVMKSSSITMKKRQMHDDEDDSAEMMEDSETTEGITATTDETTKLLVLKSAEATEKYKQEESNECMFYKDVPEFSFEAMADVWKITFYKAFDKLSCFKIHIKKTTVKNRKIWQDKYGDFNGTIDWKNCQFEVASSALKTERSERRHFLQGSKEDKGVFDNIILTADGHGKTMVLLEQSPDQWLVVNHLLLMRDCDNGDVVVFSRLPIEPSLRDIEDALTSFGEDASNRTLACEKLRDPKYQTLS